MNPPPLHFRYRGAEGREDTYLVVAWSEQGHYVTGHEVFADAPRTFRKDRVIEWLDGCEFELRRPYVPPPVLPKAPADDRAQILFTGFPHVQRAALEAKAASAGLRVVKTVTHGLMYLCGGPNAGPSKVSMARAQHVYILSEPQFHALLATGELPDDEAEEMVL